MPIRAKVDEDLPAEVAERLRDAGHDATTVVEQGMTGSPDEQLWDIASREHRWVFTADKGFADVRTFRPQGGLCTVLFRLPIESRAGYLRLVELLLSELELERCHNAIIVASPSGVRIHRME